MCAKTKKEENMNRFRSMKKTAPWVAFLLFSALVFPFMTPVALAQATTGSIRGVATDQTGAVVPDATVVAKNQETGVTSPVNKTTSDGVYNISNLIPGKYTLTVEAPNFKRAVFTDIDVKVGEPVTIDAALQPGGASETVTITAGGEEVVNK